jgi:hypothetical protein
MIGAVSQLAQIGPIMIFLLKCKCISCFDSKGLIKIMRKYEVSDRVIIYFLYFIGLSAGALIALFWDKTTFVFAKERSVAFFTCVFFLAILDCTCTISFLTYIGSFRGNYITALYIGEGISSLLPSLFALMQGTGEFNEPNNRVCQNDNSTTNHTGLNKTSTPPRFSVSAYFWLLFLTLVVSFVAFLALEFWPSFKRERLSSRKSMSKEYRNYEDNDETGFNDNCVVNESLFNRIEIEKIAAEHEARLRKRESLDKTVLLVAITIVSL